MSKNKYTIDNYSKLKRHQKNSICLFKNYLSDCNNNGKTAKNHLISKAGYLEKISHENKVLSFKFHDRDNKRFNGQLIEQTIEKVNLFNAFCSKHDNNLFNEMENRKKFDETNKKQLFQFAFRAFTFSFYQNILKNNKDFDRMVSDNLNKIAKVHLEIEKRIFEKYVFLMKEENWEGVETEIIRLNKKCEFISCWAGRVNIGTNGLYRIGPSTISINIFPDENETVILLSYLKDDTYSFDKKFCKKLKKLAKKNENKFINYIEKFILIFDHNIVISPTYWSEHDDASRVAFYKIAHTFPKVKNLKKGLLSFLGLKKLKLKKHLIH